MELLKFSKRRSRLSEWLYVGLNIALAVMLLLMSITIESKVTAFALVIISKWRIFAVRPRFWWANIVANIVDIIIGLSIVVLLYAAVGNLVLQIVLTVLYIVWLLFIKPRSKRGFIATQAAVALFLGTTAAYMIFYDWNNVFIVLSMFVIGYSTARHLTTGYDEPKANFYGLLWGLLMAEFGWVFSHWVFVYSLPGFGGVKLVQAALIVCLIGFVAERVYHSKKTHEVARAKDVIMPVLFAVSIVLILALFFNSLIGDIGY